MIVGGLQQRRQLRKIALRFSYAADHPLGGEFEDQMTALIRDYKGDGEYLSPHHPDEQSLDFAVPEGRARRRS